MLSKLFASMLFIALWSNERLSVYGERRFLVTTGFIITNQRILWVKASENEDPVINEECGGLVTRAPGRLELALSKRESEEDWTRCSWTLRAPPSQRAYVRDLEIIRTAGHTHGPGTLHAKDLLDPPIIQIYDGPEPRTDKRLYRFGNDTLNNSISSQQELTVTLQHRLHDKYIQDKIIINYGFIHESLLLAQF